MLKRDHTSFNANYKLDKNFVQPLTGSINNNTLGNNFMQPMQQQMNNEEMCHQASSQMQEAVINGSIKLMSEQSAGLIRLMPNPAALTSDYKKSERTNSVASSFVPYDPTNI